MTKSSRKCRFLPLLALFLVLMVLSPTAVLASSAGKTVDLTITAPSAGKPIQGVEFGLHQVSADPFDPALPLTETFAEYPVSLTPAEADHWRVLASTLAAYIKADHLKPDYTAETGKDGKALFSGLPAGIYLVTGDRYNSGTELYVPTPYLISLPSQTASGWSYSVETTAKFDIKSPPPETPPEVPPVIVEYAQLSVLKVWDDGNRADRPTQVTVSLYNDGSLWSTVTLSKENNWQHTWTQLPLDGQWFLTESEVPEGYTVTVERQNTRFVVTNHAPPPPPEEPPVPETPPENPDDPNRPGRPLDPDDPLYWLDENGMPLDWRDRLPQTGVLWWPVPVLLSGGLFLMLVGVLLRRRKLDEA